MAEIILDIDWYIAPSPSEYTYEFYGELEVMNSIQRAEFPMLAYAHKAYHDALEDPNESDLISAPAIWYVQFFDSAGRDELVSKDKRVGLNLFAALEVVFKEFIKTYDPLVFTFDAKIADKSRVKLYDLLARKIGKHGYDVQHKDRKFRLYLFTKKGIDDDWWKEQHYEGV
jgi:hypothetical protein